MRSSRPHTLACCRAVHNQVGHNCEDQICSSVAGKTAKPSVHRRARPTHAAGGAVCSQTVLRATTFGSVLEVEHTATSRVCKIYLSYVSKSLHPSKPMHLCCTFSQPATRWIILRHSVSSQTHQLAMQSSHRCLVPAQHKHTAQAGPAQAGPVKAGYHAFQSASGSQHLVL